MKKYDVVALGELLIDFTVNGISPQGNTIFEANPGGAPCNVLAMLNRLGKKTAFIGKVGKDMFGTSLKETLEETGIDTKGLLFDEEVRTTLAFVKTSKGGERDFSFYRNPGADMMLEASEIDEELLSNTKVFHFGTLSMTNGKNREATQKALEIAKENGALVSFDPNLREPLWKSLSDAKRQTAFGLLNCDILKIADNELKWFIGEEDIDEAMNLLRERYKIPLILLSLGKEGSRAYYKDICVEMKPFLLEETIETTGAGDTFGGCCLAYVLKYGLDGFDEERLREMLRFANAAAALITTKRGALKVMPDVSSIEKLLCTH